MPKPESSMNSDRSIDLDARYGRIPSARRRARRVGAVSALAFVVVIMAWLVWGGLLGAPAQFQAVDTRHRIIDNTSIEVTWEFTAHPGTEARCAVQALNSSFAIVGWKEVDLPASAEISREFTARVITTEQAVTGLIYRCWLT